MERNHILLGGFFTEVEGPKDGRGRRTGTGGLEAHGFARFDTTTLEFEALHDSAVDDSAGAIGFTESHIEDTGLVTVNAIECINPATCDVVFVGGFFGRVAGVTSNNIAKIDLTNWAAPIVSPLQDFNQRSSGGGSDGFKKGMVRTIGVVDERFIVFGGDFTGAGGEDTNSMITSWEEGFGFSCIKNDNLLQDSSGAQGCTVPALCCTALFAPVYAIEVLTSKVLLVGGSFQVTTNYGAQGRNIAMLVVEEGKQRISNDCQSGERSCFVTPRQAAILPVPVSAMQSTESPRNISVLDSPASTPSIDPALPLAKDVYYTALGVDALPNTTSADDARVNAIECRRVYYPVTNKTTFSCLVGGRFDLVQALKSSTDSSSSVNAVNVTDLMESMGDRGVFALETTDADTLDRVVGSSKGAFDDDVTEPLFVFAQFMAPAYEFPQSTTVLESVGEEHVSNSSIEVRALILKANQSVTPLTTSESGGVFLLPATGEDGRDADAGLIAGGFGSDQTADLLTGTGFNNIAIVNRSGLPRPLSVADGTITSSLGHRAPSRFGSEPSNSAGGRDGRLSSGVRSFCPQGAVCPFPGVAVHCPIGWGLYCKADTFSVCAEGHFCPIPSQHLTCPKGSYCLTGQVDPFPCLSLDKPGCGEVEMDRPNRGYALAVRVVLMLLVLILLKYVWKCIDGMQEHRRDHALHKKWDARMEVQREYGLDFDLKGSKRGQAPKRPANHDPSAKPTFGAAMHSMAESTSKKSSEQQATISDESDSKTPVRAIENPLRKKEGLPTMDEEARGETCDEGGDIVIPLMEFSAMGRMAKNRKLMSHRSSIHTVVKQNMDSPEGIDIEFEDLGVELKSGRKILQGVTGKIVSGKLTALMGPSGAGKTTFLSALADRIEGASVVGMTKLNGVEMPMSSVRHIMGFVPQEDTMHRNLTVKQNLHFYSLLKMDPSRMTEEERRQLVTDVILAMQMVQIRHELVGDENVRGISGGQRKRLNVAIELMGSPTLLFLDEPTSGLDSTSTEELVGILSSLARTGMTVAMVIHQPRYEVYELLDELVLLGRGGRTVYAGPREGALPYFCNKLPGQLTLPERSNPADFFLDVISSYPDPTPLFTCWAEHFNGLQAEGAMTQGGATEEGREFLEGAMQKNQVSIPAQAMIMMERSFVQQSHAKGQILGELALLCVIGLLIGSAMDKESTQQQILTLVIGLTAMLSALKIFGKEGAVFKREARSGISSSAYLLGKAFAYLPKIALAPAILMYAYVPAAYPRTLSVHMYISLVSAELCCCTIGVFVSLMVKEESMEVTAVVLGLISFLFSGNSPTLASIEALGPVGKFAMAISYSRWCSGGLAIAYVQSLPPVLLEGGIEALNKIGHTNIAWTTIGNEMPQREYELLDEARYEQNCNQAWLFFSFFVVSFIAISWKVVVINQNTHFLSAKIHDLYLDCRHRLAGLLNINRNQQWKKNQQESTVDDLDGDPVTQDSTIPTHLANHLSRNQSAAI
jgi:ABC-type multidrug transport system ATPase subunit